MTAPCPVCGKSGAGTHRPFCSPRCADIDLGRWLTAQYVVPGDPHDQGDALDHLEPVE